MNTVNRNKQFKAFCTSIKANYSSTIGICFNLDTNNSLSIYKNGLIDVKGHKAITIRNTIIADNLFELKEQLSFLFNLNSIKVKPISK